MRFHTIWINAALAGRVAVLASQGHKIEAIKTLRNAGQYGVFMLGLREAKEIVDAITFEDLRNVSHFHGGKVQVTMYY